LQRRETLYSLLAYYERRANKALSEGKFDAHCTWATKYHNLRRVLEG
jgi:hypothetical protein